MTTRRFATGTESRLSLMMILRAEDLRKASAFAELDDEERLDVAERLQDKRVKKDAFVFHEGTQANALYIVKSGKVKVFKTNEDGKEQILGIFDKGDMFGAGPVFSGGMYPASAAAIVNSEVYVLHKEDCLHLVGKYPKLTMGAMRVMTDRLRQAHDMARDLAFQSVSQRTAGLLYRLAKEHGVQSESGLRIDLALSRDELAEMVGTSRETFIRALSRLAKAGIIALEKRTIIIVDEHRLQTRAET